mmetsp:Transcript_8856/g.26265  ORF Transcript_8856/g.26265 Transcript_8856/m.26265 type:complete len:1382 (+) Transcript_8856:681-4826(+)
MDVGEQQREDSPLWNSPRSINRKESPWMRDHRRAPRSVRTPPPNTTTNSSNSHRSKRRLPKSSTNPFDSPLPSSGSRSTATPASRNPSPSEGGHRMAYTQPPPSSGQGSNTAKTGTNPFDSPTPVRKTPNSHTPFDESPASTRESLRLHSHYPPVKPGLNRLDTSSSSSFSEDSSFYPHVRVTVHTQQNAPSTTTNNQVHPTKQGSVALDSLEQILDVTEETTADESEDYADSMNGKEKEDWSDEPYAQRREQVEPQRGYSPHLQREEQLFYPYPPQSHPNIPSQTAFSSGFSRQNSAISEDGSATHTTASPSEKALKAAETLKKSFEQRRRQKKTRTRKVATIDEDEEQPQPQRRETRKNFVLDDSPAKESPVVLGGVAGKRRADADAKNVAAAAAASFAGNPNKPLLHPKPQPQPPQNKNHIERQTVIRDASNGLAKEQEHDPQETEHTNNNDDDDNAGGNYTLHDLCDEAVSTDDLAWHNALYLLSIRADLGHQIEPECMMTPLHVTCLAQKPPPIWLTRGLLYAAPATCRQPDKGGRLPLHLLVATTADLDTIRLLVEEYPPSVAHRDDRGFTPLQLLLKRNDSDGLTLEHLRLLLGQQIDVLGTSRKVKSRFLFRRGDHLKNNLLLQDLEALAEERQQRHESMFREYPDDVRRALTKLSQWKRRQLNKQNIQNTEDEIYFLQSRNAEFVNPASIPTPTGQLLPLHLLVRRSFHADRATMIQDIHSIKRAEAVDLLRVLIAAYPQGLVGVDANGKTPVMTAMLQKEAPPTEEIIELLLGLRTPGFNSRANGGPATIPTGDTVQTPLHVAAEEYLSNYSLLNTICESYPGARTAQDAWGRTPLHLAFQNYRSIAIDEATLQLLFVEAVAKIKDNTGKTPLDLLLENPACVVQTNSKSYSADSNGSGMVFQQFFDSSVERPRNRMEARDFLSKFQSFPPWLRRQACAARFVQDVLVEEIASPFTTFRIMGSGIVLILLLVALRRMLHQDPEYTYLIYYLAIYHLLMQLIQWGIAIYMGECFRLCVLNIWRWFDLAAAILSIWCATYVSREIIDVDDGIGLFLSKLGACATMACWLSLLGYFAEWSCGLAVFIGSACQLLTVLVWPLLISVMGFFATSQVLHTLEDCTDGGMCSVSESYSLLYLTILGYPVWTDADYKLSPAVSVILFLFAVSCIWWILSAVAMIVTESNRLDRRQLSLTWYWEPKVVLTALTSGRKQNEKFTESPSFLEQYCDQSEKYWHILSTALRGEKSDVHWDACCFHSTPLLFLTGFLALFLLPIWFALGLFSLGLLWPPQIRRCCFSPCPASSTIFNKGSRSVTLNEDDLTRTKLSQLRTELIDLKASTSNQNHRIQTDLTLIKDIIFRVAMDGEDDCASRSGL